VFDEWVSLVTLKERGSLGEEGVSKFSGLREFAVLRVGELCNSVIRVQLGINTENQQATAPPGT
jgi:hypothetical protein